MSKKILQFIQTKKLVLALGLAGALAFTGGVYVSAQSEVSTEPVVAETVTEGEETETPTITTPTVTLVEQEVVNEEVPAEEVVETPVIEDGAATLEQAQVIAQAEHPEGTIKMTKTKEYEGQTVFKFYFTDGWKVVVRASDGTVVRVIDASDHDHDCQNKYKKNREQATAVSAQARSDDSSRWSNDRGDHDSRRGHDRRGHR